MSVSSPDWASNFLKSKFWKLFQMFFVKIYKMVSAFINVIYTAWAILFKNTINRSKGCNFAKKETLAQMFSCEFSEFSRNNFFIEHFWATAFVLSFVNPRKKSKGTSLVKFLQSCNFNIKWRKDQLKRKNQNQPRRCIKKGALKSFAKFKHL